MKLQLLAKHFKGTKFVNPVWNKPNNCPIEKALKSLLKPFLSEKDEISEGVVQVGIIYFNDKKQLPSFYPHQEYEEGAFLKDKEKARLANWDDTVIRTINIPTLKLKDFSKNKNK